MPSKTQVGLFALGSGFLGVAGYALWSFRERRRRHQEARVAALMLSKDDSEGEVAKDVVELTPEDQHVEGMMKDAVALEPSNDSSSGSGVGSGSSDQVDRASSEGSPSGSGSNSPELVEESDDGED